MPQRRQLRKASIRNPASHRPFQHTALSVVFWLFLIFSLNLTEATELIRISGIVLDPQGVPVAGAHLKIAKSTGTVVREAVSDAQGNFTLELANAGEYRLTAESDAFAPAIVDVTLTAGQQKQISLQFRQLVSVRQAVTVIDSVPSSLAPDPAQTVVIHDQVLDANPGRPGAPISLPGLPIETASGGIKAPQYFAPGVAGDHGEPIAQFFQIGSFLYPNNLPANAHGNGYSDPNVLIPPMIESVTVDGGAFNVREGNHSIDLAATYVPRQRLNDFVQLSGDYRDFDLMVGWSPQNPETNAWITGEFSFGNGFLDRLEHRQQYKLNGLRQFKIGNSNQLTLFDIGYYGFSYIPGLIPILSPVPNDTIDNRQSDTTHNILLVATDNWKIGEHRQFSFSGFFRNYALQLRSNFGDGLIQQSETRNVVGGNSTYMQTIRPWILLLAGVDLRRDAPQNLDLKRIDENGAFLPVSSNNLTLSFVEPFVSLDGLASKYFHFDVGVRQEEVWMNNQDLINRSNSFDRLSSLSLPKATITFVPPERPFLPIVAFSYGEAFHTEDPRIGNGTGQPNLLAPSRAYLRVSKVVKQTQLSLTLRRTSNSQELAKINPDTGLQEDIGPALNRVIAISLQRTFTQGSVYISYAQADARDTRTGSPVPEAPRMIWDAVASENHLPLRVQARGEFEFVKAKPLGDGFVGVPVIEVRGALLRPFFQNRMSLGLNFLIASGYTGQTTETVLDQPALCRVECVVGVPLKSYVSLSWIYYLKR